MLLYWHAALPAPPRARPAGRGPSGPIGIPLRSAGLTQPLKSSLALQSETIQNHVFQLIALFPEFAEAWERILNMNLYSVRNTAVGCQFPGSVKFQVFLHHCQDSVVPIRLEGAILQRVIVWFSQPLV
eukprot:15752114-Heterocapsa_arctica.AAC.1